MKKRLISSVEFFRKCQPSTVVAVSKKMTPIVCIPGEVIIGLDVSSVIYLFV